MTAPRPPGADAAAVRAELRAWLADNWDPELSLAQWRIRLADSGWAFPGWPREWGGRALSPALALEVTAELAAAVVPGPPEGIGPTLAAPVILEHGTEEQKHRLLRLIATGQVMWCQLFSEPGAGSDLAGLATRAERDGDEWMVSGQKVWNTGAATADFGILLARTDPSVPKHQGITCFVLPMHQPGVVVRPLRQMNGHASFNEVFLDQARVPAGNMLGAEGNGWRVALAVLAHERRLVNRSGPAPARATGRAWAELAAERTAAAEPHKWYPQRAGRARPDRRPPPGHRPGRRPAGAPGGRRADHHGPDRAVDRGPHRRRPRRRAPARPGGLAGQAGRQPDRQGVGRRCTRGSPGRRACWPGRRPSWAGRSPRS